MWMERKQQQQFEFWIKLVQIEVSFSLGIYHRGHLDVGKADILKQVNCICFSLMVLVLFMLTHCQATMARTEQRYFTFSQYDH